MTYEWPALNGARAGEVYHRPQGQQMHVEAAQTHRGGAAFRWRKRSDERAEAQWRSIHEQGT